VRSHYWSQQFIDYHDQHPGISPQNDDLLPVLHSRADFFHMPQGGDFPFDISRTDSFSASSVWLKPPDF
jgi:hypothetical protein